MLATTQTERTSPRVGDRHGFRDLDGVTWMNLPGGGVLEMDEGATPAGLAMDLRLVIDPKSQEGCWVWICGSGEILGLAPDVDA